MIHGEETTIKTRVGGGSSVYTKRVKFCAVHGQIDLFYIGSLEAWEKAHGKCDREEKAQGSGLELPDAARAAAA